jgi:hypothetical protein
MSSMSSMASMASTAWIGSSTWVGGYCFLPAGPCGRLPGLADRAGLTGLVCLVGLVGFAGRLLAPGLEATCFFCGRRFAASADASPSDLFFAIAACLPCTTKLRQGSHTAA